MKKETAQEDAAGGAPDSYKALFENSADAILIIKGDKFMDCNQAAVDMLRARNKAEVLQTHPSELSPETQPDGRPSFEKANEIMSLALEKGTHRFEWDHRRMDGEVFPVEVLLTAIPSEDGDDLHTVWRDITERRRLENELRHAQKMETVGRLAGGIAHDFNNQLVPILGYADMLKAELSDNPRLQGLASAIEDAGHRAAALVNRLMVFSHKESRLTRTIDLNETVTGLLGMIRQLIGEDVTLDFQPSDIELPVEMDAGDVEQVVLNLCSNARDAMPTGGRIQLTLDTGERRGRQFARMEVQDSGEGMDAETRAQIFEPFFTTKGIGSGTGLGLSTVYSLVGRAEGMITVTSAPGHGSRFEVLLPLSAGPVQQPASEAASNADVPVPSDSLRNAHILVVEDEDAVARLVDEVLSRAGCQVTRSRDGIEAMKMAMKGSFDLILSDVIMPNMSGPHMVRELRAAGVTTPVMFLSGYTHDRLRAHGFEPGSVTLLRKPFTTDALIDEVGRALEGR